MADGKVTIDTQLNNKGFARGLNSMKSQTNGLTSAVKKLGAAIGAAFAVRQIIEFGKECIELGSNVAEVQNVVDVAFGDMSYKIEAFADSAIQNFGMSQLAAKKTASTYMAMAKGMGMADEAASDMAITLTGMTGDVASFYNLDQEAAATKLKSVFTGETEALKDLGVVMTQANLEAYALEKGITKDIDAMTQAEKVALRYGFVMDSLALANGDFARTSNSWANQTRILSMQWEEFMSIIGQALITVLTPLVKILNTIVSRLISMANVIKTVVEGLFGVQQPAQAVSGAISESVENQEALTDETKETAKAQKALIAGFDEINKLGSENAGSSASVGSSLSFENPFDSIFSAAESELQEIKIPPFIERLINIFKEGAAEIDTTALINSLGRLKEALAPFAEAVGEGLLWFLENVLVPLGVWTINEAIPQFLNNVADALHALNEAGFLDGLTQSLQGFVDFFGGIFTGDIERTCLGISGIFEGLELSISAILEVLREGFDGALEWLDEVTGGKLSGIIDFVRGLFDGLFEFVDVTLGDVLEGFEEILNGFILFISGVFTGDWEQAWEGVKGIFSGIFNTIIGILEGAVNLIINGLNWLISQMNKISFDMPDWLGGGHFGINIPTIRNLSLPRLATGAVIPPNREFLAVLGDQRSGNNIEAPEGLIRQIVREEAGGMNTELLQAILEAIKAGRVMTVDKKVLARTAAQGINDMTIEAGKPVLIF